jgi:glycosyltransferase involved in cell wall biosynthesis
MTDLREKSIVVMPAYNAAATLRRTVEALPFESIDEIIIVDDASRDTTLECARALPEQVSWITTHPNDAKRGEKVFLTIVSHAQNKGYGGNQKTCYRLALEHGATCVVMIHPDFQYDPTLAGHMADFIQRGVCDIMLGSRIRNRTQVMAGGMPAYKYCANRILSGLSNMLTGYTISDWHTGMRSYSRRVLEHIPFARFSDDFVFDSQMLFSIAARKYAVGEIPVPVRYFDEASSISFRRSVRYGLLTVREMLRYCLSRIRNFFRLNTKSQLQSR